MSRPNGILDMNPEQYRELDGVVFDLDSFARHCGTTEPTPPPEPAPPIPEPTGILAMDPERYRAIDGVAMDADSYERHSQPAQETPPPAEEQPPQPAGVFACDPFPAGWYPAEEGQPPVPIMGGALPPVEILEDGTYVVTVTRTVFAAGSGSGSYAASYTTSYRTSYRTSGSGSYRFGSCTCMAGGYGLELV